MTKSLDKSISPIHSPATSCHLDPQKLPPKVKQREQMPDDEGISGELRPLLGYCCYFWLFK